MPDAHSPDLDGTMPRSAPPVEGTNPAAPSTVRAAGTATAQPTDETVLPNSASAPSTDAGDATQTRNAPARVPARPGSLFAVPGYVVTREVARGGMGAVYLAHDPAFDRDVAVKVMHPGQDAERFVIESKVTAQLPHPGVPPVYALGTLPDGRPFLAMKLIQGRTLAEELRAAKPADLPRLVGAFEAICQTVGFAHARGIIHRDLKPANVMVGAFGEVLVMDWGLARAVSSAQTASGDTDLLAAGQRQVFNTNDETQAGQIKGTPAYMAPEQARGEPVDARADVFALGGILAAILTGKAPFSGTTVMETVQKAAQADVADCFARVDACAADADLIAVAKRCMAARADDRYANGVDVAAAVAAYRAGVEERLRTAERERAAAEAKAAEEVNTRREAEARADAERAKVEEQRKRRRVQLVLAACVALFVAAGAATAWYSDRQASERKLKAERAAAEQLAKEEREAAEQRAKEAKLEGERDAEARNKAQQARAGVAAGLALATDLRKEYKFKAAKGALAQAAKLAAGAPELLPKVNQALADLALAVELDDIRCRKWVWKTDAKGKGDFDTKMAPPAYRKALAARGLDIAALEPAEAAKRVAASAVKTELVAALDDWALYEEDDALESRLLEVARRADPGAWTDRLRDPAVRKNPLLLVGLIGTPDPDPSPTVLVMLAALMTQMELDPSVLLSAAWHEKPTDFELPFALAQYYIGKGRGADAIGPYEAARAVRPDNATVWNNLGTALYEKGDKDGAEFAFLRAAELDSGYASAFSNLGKAAADTGDLDRAIKLYRRALKADPKHVNAHLGLGNALSDKKDFDGAIASYRAIIEIEPGNAFAHNNLGNALASKGDPDAAIKSYKTAIEHDPKYAFPWHGLGKALSAKGDRDGAIAAYQKALEIDPKFVDVLMDLGNALRKKGDVDGAIAAQRRAVEAAPKNALAHYHLGLALGETDDLKAEAAAYREAIKCNPDLFQAHTNLASTLLQLGDPDGAVASAREGIRCNPKDPRPHNFLGLALDLKGDKDGAIAAFRAAVKLNPAFVAAYRHLGGALFAKGDKAGAADAFREAVKRDPKDAESARNLGISLYGNNDKDGAITAFREAVKRDPKDAQSFENLAVLLRDKGDKDGAIDAFREAAKLEPTAGRYDELANLLVQKGDTAGAVVAWKEAVKLDPGRALAQFNLGVIHLNQTKLKDAIVYARAAIKADPKFANAHALLGSALEKAGDLPGARDAFTEAARLDKRFATDLARLTALPVAPAPREVKRP